MSSHPPARAVPAVVARFVRRRPLLSFLVWFFTVGQAVVFVPLLARELFGVRLAGEPFLIAASLVGLALPTVVITYLTDGAEGLRVLRRRALALGVPARWYGLVLVGVPLLALVGVAGASGPPVVSPLGWVGVYGVGFVVQLVVVFVTVNLWEEVAWMGLVQARLQDRHGALRAALLTAPVFALGHISQLIGESVAATLILLGTVTVVAVPFRALLGWVANRTDSLALVGLVHGAANAAGAGSVLGVGMLDRLYPGQATGGLVVPLLAALGLVVLAATRGHLGHPGHPGEGGPRED